MGIEYLNQDLFDAPEGSILVHACNAQGVWGSGIAAEFKKQTPESFQEYNSYCKHNILITGTSLLIENYQTADKFQIGCLITSEDFGSQKDHREIIKINTALALRDLCQKILVYGDYSDEIIVYSNKFNSGLFDVPWKQTELILEVVLNRYQNIKWIVCDKETN